MTFRVWWMAARPKTLWAASAPVLMGTAMAWDGGVFHGPAALCALLGALLIQIGTNYANDYFDHQKGTDTAERIGPLRVTQAGLVSPGTMRKAMALVFLLALIPGACLVYRGGWPLVAIGLASILCGILYTAGPAPLGYIGLADLFVLVFFGPVAVGGTYYVQALSLPPEVAIAGLAPGLLSVALLTVNNLRDIDGDRAAGKRTLAVRFGRSFARAEYLLSLVIACVAVPLYLVWRLPSHTLSLLALGTIILAVPAVRTVFTRNEGPALNGALAHTGRLLILFSVLFSIGWILSP
ncbi:MAG: 1,4-dihydroxy-2-naphthoate polyprenyltransferase [FCB group bacterium]|jgi:1,4-dihydroxy-2-naphthoate octaprenyltransferase|nr:1,4-dihydroxy-2-naphthoate polyprenyltransferase [FCB group bacterium]